MSLWFTFGENIIHDKTGRSRQKSFCTRRIQRTFSSTKPLPISIWWFFFILQRRYALDMEALFELFLQKELAQKNEYEQPGPKGIPKKISLRKNLFLSKSI